MTRRRLTNLAPVAKFIATLCELSGELVGALCGVPCPLRERGRVQGLPAHPTAHVKHPRLLSGLFNSKPAVFTLF